MKKQISVAALIAAALVGGSVTASNAATAEVATGHSWSGRSIVEGVALGSGPVADALGLVQEPSDGVTRGDLAEGRRVEKEILDDIMLNRKGVSDAVQALRSGDPYRVEDGRAELASMFATSLRRTNPELVPNAGAQPRCGVIAACAVVAVLGAALGVVVVVVAESAVVGHAAVYAKQALWGKSAMGDNREEARRSTPTFTSAEFTARLNERSSASRGSTLSSDGG